MGADNRGLGWLEAGVTLPKTDATGQWAQGISPGPLQRDRQAQHTHTHIGRQAGSHPGKQKADGLKKNPNDGAPLQLRRPPRVAGIFAESEWEVGVGGGAVGNTRRCHWGGES